ncbi:uncharacterized protein LOC126893882 [Daktulosphaira vitifoliae]|uniref:uncharacterized protein LOC126893882 n=1 Tax=Daktulosphaira vitifoliae TaxID=58002 RepID=UPI0021A996FB|nr:uncharacterized protein LOC126893882 [Daktulosphaira vitifoliae]
MTTGEVRNELAVCIIRRGQIKAQLTKFQAFINDLANHNNQTQIGLRLEKIKEKWNEFDNIQNNIETLDPSEENLEYCDIFVDTYFEIVAKAEDLLKKFEIPNNVGSNNRDRDSLNSHINNYNYMKVKPPEIPTFGGKFEEWCSFKDHFNSLINSDSNMPKIHKFYHLRSALTGEASLLIQNLKTTEANYDVAWSIINNRYENKRILIQAHTKEIYDLESVNGESAVKLNKFNNSLKAHMQALKALGEDPEKWGALLLHVICKKIDMGSIRQWEQENDHNTIPTVQSLMLCLDKRCKVLESIESAKIFSGKDSIDYISNKFSKMHNKKTVTALAIHTKMQCYMCKKPHPIYKCPDFLSLSLDNRKIKCKSRKCMKCQGEHNSLLYQSSENENTSSNAQINMHTVNIGQKQTLLAAAIVRVMNTTGNYIDGRALLDSGSQSHFITTNLVNKLGLKREKVNVPISGISESRNSIKYKVTASICSKTGPYATTIDFYVLPKITGLLLNMSMYNINIPENIIIADPTFNEPVTVDVLIGAGPYWDLMCVGKFKAHQNGLYLQKTCLGWVVVGEGSDKCENNKVTCMLVMENKERLLENKIEAFWEIEELDTKQYFPTEEETLCTEHFNKNTTRNNNGRFIVRLPFRNNGQLGYSYYSALRQFLSLENRLIKDSSLYDKYKLFMREYKELGHMKCIGSVNKDKDEINRADYYYLPHSYVLNDNSRSTRLRVVFNDEINIYKLCTVTYGLVPSGFLAIGCINRISEEVNDSQLKEVLKNDFCVDDCLTGANSLDEALCLRDKLIECLRKYGFELSKWSSNNVRLLSNQKDNKDMITAMFKENIKTLGLCWQPTNDYYTYDIKLPDLNKGNITKRRVLASIATLFDLLGLVAPVIIVAKIFMQKLWQEKIDWDEQIPKLLLYD